MHHIHQSCPRPDRARTLRRVAPVWLSAASRRERRAGKHQGSSMDRWSETRLDGLQIPSICSYISLLDRRPLRLSVKSQGPVPDTAKPSYLLPARNDRPFHSRASEERAAEAAADLERRVAREARQDRFEIRDFPGRAAAGHSVPPRRSGGCARSSILCRQTVLPACVLPDEKR
jgi:hypothetical protein